MLYRFLGQFLYIFSQKKKNEQFVTCNSSSSQEPYLPLKVTLSAMHYNKKQEIRSGVGCLQVPAFVFIFMCQIDGSIDF